MTRRCLAGVALAFVVFAACAAEETALEGTPPPATEAGTEASVSISSPADGSTVPAGDVEVTMAAENFNIVDKVGQPPVAGEGHVHFYIDVDEIPTTAGQPAITTDESTYHAEATTNYSWPDVEAGEHTLAVQLVNNNHTPLEPPVTAEITVTVS